MTLNEDHQHPALTHSAAAAQEIRAFNHATLMWDSIRQPSTVYGALGELYTLASYLNQAYEQLADALSTQAASGALRVDPGVGEHDTAELAVAAARNHLSLACEAIQVVYDELTHAQMAIAAVYAP